MTELTSKSCIPCSSGALPLAETDRRAMLEQLSDHWRIVEGHHLERSYLFADFKQALAFTNQLGALAEAEGHHPDIHLSWGKVLVTIWTHKIDGLTQSDFVLAAKIDALA
jgi:4a-hydroxytetrahydrobiopterin dehydratase